MSNHSVPMQAPEGFDFQEIMVTYKGPDVSKLKEPRAMQSQYPIRPNLIVHQRDAQKGATLEMLAAEMCAELLTTIGSIQNLKSDSHKFSDGQEGVLVSFDFAAGKAATVKQFQALRLDDERLATATLTVDSTTLDVAWPMYEKALSSLGKS